MYSSNNIIVIGMEDYPLTGPTFNVKTGDGCPILCYLFNFHLVSSCMPPLYPYSGVPIFAYHNDIQSNRFLLLGLIHSRMN